MSKINYNSACFLTSAAELSQLPDDTGKEVAFVGRSNAGKSSAINTLTHIKNLARTSKTPGRTQLINVFTLENQQSSRLIDLPGYGYAKAPLPTKQHWEALVNQYLMTRKSLAGVVLLMDVRHPLKASDQQLVDWAMHSHIPLHILLTKSDKLSKGTANSVRLQIKKQLLVVEAETSPISIQLFSSLTKIGVDTLGQQLDNWFLSSTRT